MSPLPGEKISPSKKIFEILVRIANRPRLLVASTVVVYVASGLGYAFLEGKGPVEGIWWAIVTGFTVGYGDFYPATTAGRGIGAFLIITAFVLALCLGAQITARLVKDEHEFSHEEQEALKEDMRCLRRDLATLTELLKEKNHVQ